MQLLLLGATGRTGKEILLQALARGHQLKVLVRDRTKLAAHSAQMEIVEGNPADPVLLGKAMQGTEAILSALNISRTNDFPWSPLRTPRDFLSGVMRSTIELMPRHQVKRIIITSAWGVSETKKDIPGWFRWFINHSNIGPAYLDHEKQEELLKASTLDWTAVRPVGLTNFKKEKKIIVSLNNTPRPKLTISRRAVATFMLDALEKNLYLQRLPVISH